ncbi:hypothetical protein F183_A23870 [Bryobacterales bacterium F-183]|nr:hypothetical protein F183_A23870 [Bryobacterales bacterium F-183]
MSAAPPQSMTGYARVRRPASNGGEVLVSVKSVNHRGLDIHLHTSIDLSVENEVRTAIKKRLTRGHVEVRIGIVKGTQGEAAALNKPLFESYLASLQEAAGIAGVPAEVDLAAALRLPGMISAAGAERELPAEDEQAILSGLEEALEVLTTFRRREGAELVAAMIAHNGNIRERASKVAELRVQAVGVYKARLEERLSELLRGAAVMEPQRLAQEAAMLADRSDVSEEVTRLGIHSGELDTILKAGGEMGKKIDFLLQEMNRETNTILSKTNGAGGIGLDITAHGIAIKSEIEKIREQALNLE